jgi:DNA adenine methylase
MRSRSGSRPSLERIPAKPFVKWAGGKWSLLPQIAPLLPDVTGRTYREPFLGGGAVFFHLRGSSPPARAVLSDALTDLIGAYEAVRDQPERLVTELETLRDLHSKTHFYRVRDFFNARGKGEPVLRAAWLIYLNKTCFNGLFRTNRSGEFNVPIGRFTKPRIVDRSRLLAASAALQGIELLNQPFERLLHDAKKGDVIYLDPPYVPLSRTSNFAAYSLGAFGPEEQERLAEVFRKLDKRGCMLALSNSDTPEVRRLYQGFEIQPIRAARSIGSRGASRGTVTELLVRNPKRYV